MRVTTLILTPADVTVGTWMFVEGDFVEFGEAHEGVKGNAGIAYAVELRVEVETGMLACLVLI